MKLAVVSRFSKIDSNFIIVAVLAALGMEMCYCEFFSGFYVNIYGYTYLLNTVFFASMVFLQPKDMPMPNRCCHLVMTRESADDWQVGRLTW